MAEILNIFASLMQLKLGLFLTVLTFIHLLFLILILLNNFIGVLSIEKDIKGIFIKLACYTSLSIIYLININKSFYFIGFLIGTLLLMIFVNVYNLIILFILKENTDEK